MLSNEEISAGDPVFLSKVEDSEFCALFNVTETFGSRRPQML